MLYISADASGCKESQFYSLPLHVFALCACFRFSTYLPTIFQGIIPRKISGKYVENLKQASGEIFLVGRKNKFQIQMYTKFKEVVLVHAAACNALKFLPLSSPSNIQCNSI